jgi:uncharacterized ferredoxin-like protein
MYKAMAIIRETDIKQKSVLNTAGRMLAAARTAPKGKGRNTLEMFIAEGETIQLLAEEMHRLGDKYDAHFFHRDAENLQYAEAVVIIGTEIKTLGLNEMCKLCGFENCQEKEKYPDTPCVFNTGDLNLALGSAVAVAAADYIDNRIMFTIGKAAVNLGLFNKNIKIAHGIPLAVTSKNPFFDRK